MQIKIARKHSYFPTQFHVSRAFPWCFYNSLETRKMFSISSELQQEYSYFCRPRAVMEINIVRLLLTLLVVFLFVCCTTSEDDQNCTGLKSSDGSNCTKHIRVFVREKRAERSRPQRSRPQRSRKQRRRRTRRWRRRKQTRRKKPSCRIRIFSMRCTNRKKGVGEFWHTYMITN